MLRKSISFRSIFLINCAHDILLFPTLFYQSRNHLATIEQVKADLKATRASATADLNRVQEDLASTSQDLEVAQAELVEAKRSTAELKVTVASLNEDLARYRNLQEESTNDVRFFFTVPLWDIL